MSLIPEMLLQLQTIDSLLAINLILQMMENKTFNNRIQFQQEIIVQILKAYLELKQTITVRKSGKKPPQKTKPPPQNHKTQKRPQMLSKYAPLIISNLQRFSFWQQ